MKKLRYLLLLSIWLQLSACSMSGEEGIEWDDNSLAGSLEVGGYSIRYSLYQDDELIREDKQGTWQNPMRKVDDTHINFHFKAYTFEQPDINIYIHNIHVTGVLYDVKMSYESTSGDDYCIIDEEKHFFTHVRIGGWLKNSDYLEVRSGGFGRYSEYKITIAFTLEDGREFLCVMH